MDLPRSLAPWGSYLGIFPRDLALSLGPVLQRLSFAVGPLRVRRHQGDGEVDGYDGLARRGSYERLISSEWLLADEMPEEFLRRAAVGEHLFLRVSRPVPSGYRLSVGVFDAGPGQLGSPRIAQLAALIVLARRAEAAGVRFAWGILQEPEAALFEEVNEASVLRLLQARTPHEATDAQVAAWHARLRGWKEMDDLWFVGPPRLATVPSARGASFLQVWDVLDPEARRVAVRVRRGGLSSPAEISLALPENAVCARLLRDPFAAATPAPHRLETGLTPVSNLLFNGPKLFARAAAGGVVAYPIPNSPRAESGGPRLYDPWPGDAPVAVGMVGKGVLLAAARPDGTVALHAAQKRGGGSPAGSYSSAGEIPYRSAGARAPLRPILRAGAYTFLLDAEGALFRLAAGVQSRSLALVAERVSAVASLAAHLSFVTAAVEPGRAHLAAVVGDGAPAVRHTFEETAEGAPAFFGFGGRVAHPDHGLVAVERWDGSWALLGQRGELFLTPFAGSRVVGVARDPERHEPGLLLLEEDRRTLLLAGLSWTRKLPPASAEIQHAAASPSAPYIAWSTVHGEVVVHSLDHDAVLFRRVPEGER